MSYKRRHLHEPHPFDSGFSPDFVGGVDLDFLQGGGSDEPVIDFFGGFNEQQQQQRQGGGADEREFISESQREFRGQRSRLTDPSARISTRRRGRGRGRQRADQTIIKGDLSGSDIRTPSKNIDRRLEHKAIREMARLRAGGRKRNSQQGEFTFGDNTFRNLGYGNL